MSTQTVLSLWRGEQRVDTTPRMLDVVSEVAERYGLTVDQVRGYENRLKLGPIRQESMFLCRRLTGKSTTQVGRFHGGRDHTSVIYAERRHAARLAEQQGEGGA